VARFEHRARSDVPPGAILRLCMECSDGARFEIACQDAPEVFRWCRDLPGVPMPPHVLRVAR
jgi:hypothetical protein